MNSKSSSFQKPPLLPQMLKLIQRDTNYSRSVFLEKNFLGFLKNNLDRERKKKNWSHLNFFDHLLRRQWLSSVQVISLVFVSYDNG